MDSQHTVKAYAQTMGGLKYPLLSDWHPHGALTRELGILHEGAGCPTRTTVIVDGHGVIRDISENPMGEDRDFTLVLDKLTQLSASGKITVTK